MPHALKPIKVTEDTDDFLETKSGERRLFPPSFRVDAKQMPEIKNWSPPNEYTLVIRVKQTGKHADDDGETGEFEIVGYEHIPDKDIKDMTDKEFGEHEGRMLNEASKK